jgi:hypothetical protein
MPPAVAHPLDTADRLRVRISYGSEQESDVVYASPVRVCVATGAQGSRAAGAVTRLGFSARRQQGRTGRLMLVAPRAAAEEEQGAEEAAVPAPTETRIIVITSGKVCLFSVQRGCLRPDRVF